MELKYLVIIDIISWGSWGRSMTTSQKQESTKEQLDR